MNSVTSEKINNKIMRLLAIRRAIKDFDDLRGVFTSEDYWLLVESLRFEYYHVQEVLAHYLKNASPSEFK